MLPCPPIAPPAQQWLHKGCVRRRLLQCTLLASSVACGRSAGEGLTQQVFISSETNKFGLSCFMFIHFYSLEKFGMILPKVKCLKCWLMLCVCRSFQVLDTWGILGPILFGGTAERPARRGQSTHRSHQHSSFDGSTKAMEISTSPCS